MSNHDFPKTVLGDDNAQVVSKVVIPKFVDQGLEMMHTFDAENDESDTLDAENEDSDIVDVQIPKKKVTTEKRSKRGARKILKYPKC